MFDIPSGRTGIMARMSILHARVAHESPLLRRVRLPTFRNSAAAYRHAISYRAPELQPEAYDILLSSASVDQSRTKECAMRRFSGVNC